MQTATAIAITPITSQQPRHIRNDSFQVNTVWRRKSVGVADDDLLVMARPKSVLNGASASTSTIDVRTLANGDDGGQASTTNGNRVKSAEHKLIIGVDFGTTYSG